MVKKPFVNEDEASRQKEMIDHETGEAVMRVRNHRGSHYEDPDPVPFSPTAGS